MIRRYDPDESVRNVPVQEYEPLITQALNGYEEYTGKDIEFSRFPDTELLLAPEKPYSASGQRAIFYRGVYAGMLTVLVLGPGDGTGDENTISTAAVQASQFDPYKVRPGIMPRSKSGISSELCLPLFSCDSSNEPVLYAAHLDQLTVRQGRVRKIFTLGQSAVEFGNIMDGEYVPIPQAVGTVGLRAKPADSVSNTAWPTHSTYDEERYGDPHAIFNSTGFVQVVGFYGLRFGRHSEDFGDAHNVFYPEDPRELPLVD